MLIVFPDSHKKQTLKFHTYKSVVNFIQETQLKSLPLSADTVKKETEKDAVLSQVLLKINQGWPNTSKSLLKEFHRKLQLTVHNGCILHSHRVVIPSSLQRQILTEIHEGHMGIVRMKSLAMMHVWWPKIDENIESHANHMPINVFPVKKICESLPEHQSSHGKIPGSPGNASISISQDLLKESYPKQVKHLNNCI